MSLSKLINFLCFVSVFVPCVWAEGSSAVRLLSERHRTEWNWVEYRISLENTSQSPIKNPEIRYFAENLYIDYCKSHSQDAKCSNAEFGNFPVDSSLVVEVDYVKSPYHVEKSVQPGEKYSVISLKVKGTINPTKKVKINFRIHRKQWNTWNSSNDYSYQKTSAVQEPHYFMTVLDDSGNALWGDDPVLFKHDTSNVYWSDRDGRRIIPQYDGNSSDTIPAGRFWMLRNKPFSLKDRNAIDTTKLLLLDGTRYQNKSLYLFRGKQTLRKKDLDSTFNGIFNVFAANDTTPLKLKMNSSDLFEEVEICENNQCHKEVFERTKFNIYVQCWPDIHAKTCKAIVENCGADSVSVEQNVVLASASKLSMKCVQNNKNVYHIGTQIVPENDNYEGHESINVKALQDDDAAWIAEFNNTAARESGHWMQNFDYTGEGIYVGVYDDPIDFSHPAFRENGLPRRADGITTDGVKPSDGHGTHVAGIIGGNGDFSNTFGDSDDYKFRGVAPKVKFYSYGRTLSLPPQMGHVVNHSHQFPEEILDEYEGIKKYGVFYYGGRSATIDNYIFNDWKLTSDKGDKLTKTFVASAGNLQNEVQFPSSLYPVKLSNQTKNPIIVGSYNQSNGVISDFSSRGPTLDGRLKPDVIAPGEGREYSWRSVNEKGEAYTRKVRGIVSTIPRESNGFEDMWYGPKSGTSQAAPFVSLIAALMYQKFKKLTNESLNENSMRNSTVKALLIHSAHFYDGNKPSFTAGWGYVDAQGALALIEGYNDSRKEFDKFREFDVSDNSPIKWSIQVTSRTNPLRVAIAWDDKPGDSNEEDKYDSKLVNDIDLVLISPTGVYYYPWKIEPTGDKTCSPQSTYSEGCFDRLNNVEVVDVNNPELGLWQVVVKGFKVEQGDDSDAKSQKVSIVSDYKLLSECAEDNPYATVNIRSSCSYDLGDHLENYVTFDERTSLGNGEFLYLYDGKNNLIGIYSGNSLAGKKITVKTRRLNVFIESDNANIQGWGYAIKKIEHLSYGALQSLFDMGRRKK